jgi:hypothetical protein
MTGAARLVAARLWSGPGGSTERCRLEMVDGRPRLNGVVLCALDGRPAEVRYVVTVDAQWLTRSCHVVVIGVEGTRRLHLHRDPGGAWSDDGGAEIRELRGCTDVDLGITPATNTLPIRRLGLQPGDTGDIVAAWVRFPGLTVTRATQGYARESERRWRFSSPGFTAALEVDEHGLVVDYGDLWRSLASWPG